MLARRAISCSEPPRLRVARLPNAAPTGGRAPSTSHAHRARYARAAALAAGVLTAVGPLACSPGRGSRTALPPIAPAPVAAGAVAARPRVPAPPAPPARGRLVRASSPNVVEASAWRDQPAMRIEELLLTGRVPGVEVTPMEGGYAVRVRGAASFVGPADPLYVIDGVPLRPGLLGAINPADVARIEVLKDVADLAPYGMSGANGVVRITTRRPGSR